MSDLDLDRLRMLAAKAPEAHQRLVDHWFDNPNQKPRASIPAQPDDDDDLVTGAVLDAVPALLDALQTLTAERDRLARILAVERGDVTQAPEGWGRNGGEWRRGRWRVCLASVGAWFVFDVYARRAMLRRSRPTALEAMEALDAAEEAE